MILARVLVAVTLLGMVSGCGVAVGGAAAVGMAASKEKGLSGSTSDTIIATELNHLFLQHHEAMFRKVSTSISEGRVLLTGAVPDEAMRDEATRLAWKAEGVREVINELQVADNDAIDFGKDVMIANTLRAKLLFDKDVRNINYSIDVVNGVIYLMGLAQDQAELNRVLDHARNVEGARKVINYAMVKDDPRRYEP